MVLFPPAFLEFADAFKRAANNFARFVLLRATVPRYDTTLLAVNEYGVLL
jgi:hypothetical protein